MELTVKEKEILLKTARLSIEEIFNHKPVQQPDYFTFPNLALKAGAFVTLKIDEELRGCIGYIISDNKLFDTVVDAAKSAAIRDPRFYPLSKEELNKIEIEISVLSPPFKMNSYDEIELGKHGLIVEEHGKRGLLLPQVPIEHNMNKEEYLSSICRKAGLPAGLWRTKTLNMKLFTATVFSEVEWRKEHASN